MGWYKKFPKKPSSFSDWKNYFVVAISILSLSGCAPRKYLIRENQINFEAEPNFYLVLNEEASKIQYRYFNNPLDFEKYGGGRSIPVQLQMS